jgi:uncharacterized membrane protein (DUF4010 family)
MMYLRVIVLMFIFNQALAFFMLPYLAVLVLLALALSAIIYFTKKPLETDKVQEKKPA